MSTFHLSPLFFKAFIFLVVLLLCCLNVISYPAARIALAFRGSCVSALPRHSNAFWLSPCWRCRRPTVVRSSELSGENSRASCKNARERRMGRVGRWQRRLTRGKRGRRRHSNRSQVSSVFMRVIRWRQHTRAHPNESWFVNSDNGMWQLSPPAFIVVSKILRLPRRIWF